jgi:phenylalanyl-tRNA synthetase beta chain
MQLSISWLRDYLQKPDVKIVAADLSEKLTMRGIQVGAIRQPSAGLESVVVGRIDKIEPHPNADRLQVTRTVISSEPGAEPLQIVCGARNIAEGDLVPVAIIGASLPGGIKIKKSAIRGVESSGMLCSAKELGIDETSEGILQLPKHSVLGEPVSKLLGGQQSEDTIFELELTANRPDCLSMIGLAREISPLLKTKIRDPKPARFRMSQHRTSSIIKVEVEDPVLCPRYVARVIDEIKIGESSDWLKQRLESVGLRPINNVVDITNFVMFEYGQPLHAFDLRRIQSGTVRVGPCKEAQDFTLLDGSVAKLEPGDIMIFDGDRPIALAGIMGGLNSQVVADTTAIVLESATFHPAQIRKTAKRLGLSTEASKRFEKTSDIAVVASASDRAAGLLQDTFNANVYHPAIDTNEFGVKEPVVALDMRDVKRIAGLTQLTVENVSELLESIGISSHRKSTNVLSVRLPTFRADLRESIDLIEEVARLNGYDSIPLKYPTSSAMYDRPVETRYEFERKAKQILAGLGLRETIHYSFTSEESLKRCGVLNEHRVVLQNPLSEEMKVMRTSLLPSLLETYKYNYNRQIGNQRLFEVANIYRSEPRAETKVKETIHASVLISGQQLPETWRGKSGPVDFFQAKGALESLVHQLTTANLNFVPTSNQTLFHPNRAASIRLGDREIGQVGEIHPIIRDNYLKTTEAVVLFEINLGALRKLEKTGVAFRAPSKFPAIEVDLAFLIDRDVTSAALRKSIEASAGGLLTSCFVFDSYEGERVAAGKRSIGFRLGFSSMERTLQESEVASLKTQVIETLKSEHSATLRDS